MIDINQCDDENRKAKYVRKKWTNIGKINNPSERVQMNAVKTFVDSIQFIKNPTEKVQLYVVKQRGWYIESIIENLGRNPSKEVQKAAIDNDYKSIKYIIDPDKEIQIYALHKKLNLIFWHNIDNYILHNNKDKSDIRKPKYKNLMKWLD